MDSLENFREPFEVVAQRTVDLPHQTQALEAYTRISERRRRWRRGMACGVVMLLGAIGIVLGSVTPAHADVITCGDVLGPGGRFELEHDLACGSEAVTVQDGVRQG
jgi:hypothetical protein